MGTFPVKRTEIGPSNRVKTGKLRPLSKENERSMKSRAISRFEAATLREGETGKGFVTKSLYTDEFCRVVTSSFDTGIQALSIVDKIRAARFIPSYSILSLSMPIFIGISALKCSTFPNMRVEQKDIFGELDQIVARF